MLCIPAKPVKKERKRLLENIFTVIPRCMVFSFVITALLCGTTTPPAWAKKMTSKEMAARLSELEQENAGLRNYAGVGDGETIQELRASASAKAGAKQAEYRKMIRDLEREKRDLLKKIAELEEGIQRNAQILAKNEETLGQLSKERDSLAGTLEEKGKSEQTLQTLANENALQKKRIAELLTLVKQQEAKLSSLNPGKISEMSGTLEELQEENRKLAQALAEISSQAVASEKNRGEDAKALREGMEAKAQLQILEQENQALKAENEVLSKSKSAGPSNKAEIEKLAAQNESLRQTIVAQNEALSAGDQSVKQTALIKKENANLKLALKQREEGDIAYAKAIEELRDENKRLKNKKSENIAESASLEGLKQTIETLKAENEMLKSAQGDNSRLATGKSSDIATGTLLVKIQDLEQRLDKERAATSQYRLLIKQYQDQAQSAGPAAAPEIQKQETSVYAPEIRALMLENQELRARLELLESGSGGKGSMAPASDTKETLGNIEALPALPTASEILNSEIEAKDVTLIRQNYETLPEMPRATDAAQIELGSGDPPETDEQPEIQTPGIDLQGNALPELLPVIEEQGAPLPDATPRRNKENADRKKAGKERKSIGTNG